MRGFVIKKNADKFFVNSQSGNFICNARGVLKAGGVFVGDNVEFDENEMIINAVLNRKNLLVRPPIANLDKLFVVIANKPKPDLYLVDKLIIFCFINGISPYLCVNKIDGENQQEFFDKIAKIYEKVLPVIKLSAYNNNTNELEKEVEGICAFAGQSAVGKSSLINSILKKDIEKVGNFAKKVERGKQTTRLVTLYKVGNGYIADTAGFSQLDEDLLDIKPNEIAKYCPDIFPYISNCRYRSCLHKVDKDCGVFEAARKRKISKERFLNYQKLLGVIEARLKR